MITQTRKDVVDDPDTFFFVCVQAYTANLLLEAGHFGITMHPTSITAARVKSSGLIEVYTYKLSSGYVQYLKAVARHFDMQNTNDVYPDVATISTFRTTFAAITEDLTRKLDRLPKYSALAHPETFQHSFLARRLDSVISSAR